MEPVALRIGSAAVGARQSLRHRLVLCFSVATSFVGAVIGFALQPMIARLLLPEAGGTAAVWNTTVLFFQLALLAGYALTHVMTNRIAPRRFGLWQVALLLCGAALLPLRLRTIDEVPQRGSPSVWLIGTLTLSVGLLYLGLATSSPFVQSTFARSGHPRSNDPYFLYIASNAGSLLGLLSYPVLIEQHFGLREQRRLWGIGYLLFVLCVVGLVWLDRTSPATELVIDRAKRVRSVAEAHSQRVDRWQWVRWIGLAAVPAAVSLAATNYLTTEVVQLPLLWVLCLSMYLLSYIIAFSRYCPSTRVTNVIAGVGIGAAVGATMSSAVSVRTNVVLQLFVVFACGLAYHGRLATSRPAASQLTGYYIAVAIGGVVGSATIVLVAPLLFVRPIEYLLLLCAATIPFISTRIKGKSQVSRWLLAPLIGLAMFVCVESLRSDDGWHSRSTGDWLVFSVAMLVATMIWFDWSPSASAIVMAVAILSFQSIASGSTRFRRSFYGAVHVDEVEGFRRLVHGTTTHGYQFLDKQRAATATSYYAPTGPLGRAILQRGSDDLSPKRYGVVGLGTGTIATYLEDQDHLTFFEIDQTIVDIANDSKLFSFVGARRGQVDIVVGDGRRELNKTAEKFDVLVIDAFNSDSIPTHLLTKEALALYGSRLQDDGIVAIHVSNRYLDLEPVVGATAVSAKLASISGHYVPTVEEIDEGAGASDWVFLAKRASTLEDLRSFDGFAPTERRDRVRGWTDDRVDVVSSLTL
jgi:hypothetical protein